MKKWIKAIVILSATMLVIIALHLHYLSRITGNHNYAEDTSYDSLTNKTALIIVAHDDDMAGSAGTISMLCSKGWVIREKCYYQQAGLYFKKDSIKNPIRKQSLQHAANIQGLNGIDPVDMNIRNDSMNEKSYMPMPYDQFASHFKEDLLYRDISQYIKKYKPSIIFTLDNVMGGYGHPDHVVISQIVLKCCQDQKNDPDFTVKKIYQPVFTPEQAQHVLGKLPVFVEAKKVYQVEGMPLPDVAVPITKYARQKKEVMKGYITEQNSLRKIWPYYNWYPSWIYFRIFNKEYFRVITL